jgi:hypothetical protein
MTSPSQTNNESVALVINPFLSFLDQPSLENNESNISEDFTDQSELTHADVINDSRGK